MRQCSACPWRGMRGLDRDGQVAHLTAELGDVDPEAFALAERALAAAEAGESRWVCHVRCTPCPGPVLAGIAP